MNLLAQPAKKGISFTGTNFRSAMYFGTGAKADSWAHLHQNRHLTTFYKKQTGAVFEDNKDLLPLR